jgi:hypothetical protein
MKSEFVHQISLSIPTLHALHLVARIDRMSPDALLEQVVSGYLATRLEAMHEAHHEDERGRRRGGRVIDLAARRAAQGPARGLGSPGSRRRSTDPE